MILLLGASGYIGQAFQQVMESRGVRFVTLSRGEADYTNFATLVNYLRENRPDFIVNAAGYTGKPNVDACEIARADTLLGNTIFPHALANACMTLEIPWGHVSSGCIYSGCLVEADGQWRVEKDMTKPEIRSTAKNEPNSIRGFDELMEPNFSFRDGPCSFYSGTKALAEEIISKYPNNYIWRLRIPFDHIDGPRNYLSKIQRYEKVYDNLNSLSHRFDYANACLDTWFQKAPYGIYNVTNPGFVSTGEVLEMIKSILKPEREFQFWKDDEEFYNKGACALRSNCVMDSGKLENAGIKLRTVRKALEEALYNWQRE